MPSNQASQHEGVEHAVQSQNIEGSFCRRGLSPGLYDLVVDPAASGYERTILRGISLPSEDEVVVQVGRGAYCEGRLTDGYDEPLVGVAVSLEREDQPPGGTQTCRSGPDGEYLFTLLVPGRYRLSRMGGDPDRALSFDVEPRAQLRKDLRSVRSGRLTIAVVDESGRPLSGSSILIAGRDGERRRASTDSVGHASIEGLPAGFHAVLVTHGGFTPQDSSAELAAAEVCTLTVRLKQPSR